jgi:adenylate cyclase
MPKLVLLSAGDPREHELSEVTTLGRHPDSTIVLSDRIVSKNHARITRTPEGHYELLDLGSTNGTFVRGERVHAHRLAEGDEIALGTVRLVFRDQEAGPGEAPGLAVTISPESMERPVHRRLEAQSSLTFRPEREIHDLDELRSDYERLRIAYNLSRAVGSELDLDRLLHKILDKAFDLLPADRGVIVLIDDTGSPVPRIARHRHGEAGGRIVLSRSIVRQVMEDKQAVLSSDAMTDGRFSEAESILAHGIRSTMCVPLIHGGEVFGIMHLDTQVEKDAFREKDLQIFGSIASQAAMAIHNAQLAAQIQQEARTRAQLQRFFSPDIVQQIVEGKLSLDAGGDLRDLTCMFADIRGFTPMTEHADAHDIVNLLNNYFEAMVEVIFQNHGSLDKYIGDEIMALFGVPVAREEAAFDAVRCAIEMMQALGDFNQNRIADGQAPIEIGIGICTGSSVYGAIGSSKTLQYTVIGDTVNTASRLCSNAEPGQILISEETWRRTADRIEAFRLPGRRVKGKEGPLTVYHVVCLKGGAPPGGGAAPAPGG